MAVQFLYDGGILQCLYGAREVKERLKMIQIGVKIDLLVRIVFHAVSLVHDRRDDLIGPDSTFKAVVFFAQT